MCLSHVSFVFPFLFGGKIKVGGYWGRVEIFFPLYYIKITSEEWNYWSLSLYKKWIVIFFLSIEINIKFIY